MVNLLNNSSYGIINDAISRVSEAYASDGDPWIVGYSGGKDSTAVLKILFRSLLKVSNYHKKVTVVFSNSGVEIPDITIIAKNKPIKIKTIPSYTYLACSKFKPKVGV